MSSTLSRPRSVEPITSESTPVIEPTPVVEATLIEAAPVVEVGEADFAGFARAIAIGVAIGVPVVAVIVAVIVKLAAPDMEAVGVIAIAAWVAIWTGVFLGGTVTVGLWSARQHRHV